MCGQEKNMQTICPREEEKASIIRKFNKEKTKSEPNHGTTYMQKRLCTMVHDTKYTQAQSSQTHLGHQLQCKVRTKNGPCERCEPSTGRDLSSLPSIKKQSIILLEE
jgi:hypothetical protein